MLLEERFLKLKQLTNSLTHNPLLNCFEQECLALLDEEAVNDSFISTKKHTILKLIKNHNIDFEPKLKSAFDEYNEGLTYIRLTKKFGKVERIPEGNEKTPDFKIEFEDNNLLNKKKSHTIYLELKSMSFADGNLNYQNTIKQGVKAQIDIERQIKQGKKVAFGITEVAPLHKSNKNYDLSSTKYAIEVLIEKIDQNLKAGQFSLGETILLIDLKQLSLPSYFKEGGVPIFQEKLYNSYVSGIQWNVAFGKVGYLVYKPIEFEGKENIDGELERNGILRNYDYIKAIIFFDYQLGDKEPKIVGLHRNIDVSDSVSNFLHEFCDFVNDDKNTQGWLLDANDN